MDSKNAILDVKRGVLITRAAKVCLQAAISFA